MITTRSGHRPVRIAAVAVVLTVGGFLAAAQAGILVMGRRPAAGPPPKGAKGGLHIKRARMVGFNWQMTDGAGYRWDIQRYGSVGSGTNNAYSGGMYCRINGTNVRSNNNQGWTNAAGDEMEIGPCSVRGLKAYRRIKVYKNRFMARWLDILQNDSSANITVGVQMYSRTCWTIGTTLTSSGSASFGAKDWAFITKTTPGNPAPALLHVVGDKRSKIRPTVTVVNTQITVSYSITVPAGGTRVLCHFEAQQSMDALKKQMKTFKARKLLADLSPAVRKLIVNFSHGGGLFDIDLERTESADSVRLKQGDPINGTVKNESFQVRTLFGELTLPAAKVIGMVASTGEDDSVRFVLADGQVVNGVPGGEKLHMLLPTGSLLKIGLADIKYWSFRISKERPEEIKFAGPIAVLRTGDQLAFKAGATKLRFRTRHGTITLEAPHIERIVLDNPSDAVHRAYLMNGSVIAGFLEPRELALSLKLGKKLSVPRDMVSHLRFAPESDPAEGLTHMVLSNGDELFGRLAMPVMTLASSYGEAQVKPVNITSMRFSPTHLGRAVIVLWNGTVLRGQLKEPELSFQVHPGPLLKIHANQVVAIVRPGVLPPEHVLKKVAELVALLGAESYQDRKRATEELSRMDRSIAPMLKKYLSSTDPEVRRRIEDILQKLGGSTKAPQPMPQQFGHMILEVWDR